MSDQKSLNYYNSSKTKNLLIGLDDYHHFHSPSQPSQIDTRFIGRKSLIQKLTQLLTNSETRSGAYLVTGYRGMGKSSFVGKVLNDISANRGSAKRARFIRVLIPLLISSFLDPWKSPHSELLLLALPSIALVAIFLALHPGKARKQHLDATVSAGKIRGFLERFVVSKILMRSEEIPALRHRELAEDARIAILLYLLGSFIFRYVRGRGWGFFPALFAINTTLFLIWILASWCASIYKQWRQATPHSGEKYYQLLWKQTARSIKRRLNYSRHTHIRINLGYDDLKEIDILKLVARGIEIRYQQLVRKITFNSLGRFVAVFLIVGVFYHYKPIYKIHEAMKRDLRIVYFFPSQGASLLQNRFSFRDWDWSNEKWLDPDAYLERFRNLAGDNRHQFPSTKAAPMRQLRTYSIYLDMIIAFTYEKTLGRIDSILGQVNRLDNYVHLPMQGFYVIPPSLDYVFLLYFVAVWAGCSLFARFPLFGMVTNRYIFRLIKSLNADIDARVTVENTRSLGGTPGGAKAGLSRRRVRSYILADERTIEKRLIEILDLIDRIPQIIKKPEFVFIFDELDKIESHQKTSSEAKEEAEVLTLGKKSEMTLGSEGLRRRQETILTLLSNLKHFLNTAKAKFIFIAGREMFDASLADVSDRNFFIGSIFHDVLYVYSFLSDPSDEKLSDVTSMTEEYVCQFLIPTSFHNSEDYKMHGASLRTLNVFLRESGPKGQKEGPRQKTERVRVITALQHFITYLTYRSNGAPKKLTRYFEGYIVSAPDLTELEKRQDWLCVGDRSSEVFLQFTYYDQYIFGLITQLFNPFLFSISRAVKDFGDKLLVSTSFLVDHLYKFHERGFSWRNLELVPEIVDINKSPQLRELISNILTFLSRTHIQPMLSGMYSFKFSKRVSEEISFVSKISERESAAFNFTLDESLMVKRRHMKQLREIEARAAQPKQGSDVEYVNSIGFCHMILGDLHFYDEEYNDAILHYFEATQVLKEKYKDIDHFVLLIRNMLKLGFSFEKRKTYDSALVTYSDAAAQVIAFADSFRDRIVWRAKQWEEDSMDLPSFSDRPIFEGNRFGTEKEVEALKMSIIESVRILSQAFLARLHIIEKRSLSGVSNSDVERLLQEFDFLVDKIEKGKRRRLRAEFLNKLADILYYKNGLLPSAAGIYCKQKEAVCFENSLITPLWEKGGSSPCRACGHYLGNLRELASHELGISPRRDLIREVFLSLERDSEGGKRISSVKTIALTLSHAGDTFLSCSSPEEALSYCFLDTFLKIVETKAIGIKADMIAELMQKRTKKNLGKIEEVILYYYAAALYFKRASDHGEYAMQLLKILYVLREYLAIRKSYIRSYQPCLNLLCGGDKLGDILVSRAIKGIYRTYESTHRLEIAKYQNIFETSEWPRQSAPNVDLITTSVSTEVKEIIFAFIEIQVACLDKDVNILLQPDFKYWYHLSDPYTVSYNMYNRILGLRLKAKLNHRVFSHYVYDLLPDLRDLGSSDGDTVRKGFEKIRERLLGADAAQAQVDQQVQRLKRKGGSERVYRKQAQKIQEDLLKMMWTTGSLELGSSFQSEKEWSGQDLMEFLIADSIYCFHEICQICRIYGISYIASHSALASAHKRLGEWCDWYYDYINIVKNGRQRIEDLLTPLIGAAEVRTLSPKYHFELALMHYRYSLEVHREGGAYKDVIEKMYYLEDDFHDTWSHSYAALDRYRVNSGMVRTEIERLKSLLEHGKKGTTLYDHRNYVRGPDPDRQEREAALERNRESVSVEALSINSIDGRIVLELEIVNLSPRTVTSLSGAVRLRDNSGYRFPGILITDDQPLVPGERRKFERPLDLTLSIRDKLERAPFDELIFDWIPDPPTFADGKSWLGLKELVYRICGFDSSTSKTGRA